VSALRVHVREGLSGLRRDWRTAALALLVVTASVLILAIVLAASSVMDRAVERVASGADVSVFLEVDSPGEARARVEGLLRGSDVVEDVVFVDAAQAATRFRRAFPDLAPLLDDHLRLPAGFDVRLRAGGQEAAVARLIARIEADEGVDSVRYDRALAERGRALASLVRRAGWVLAAVLGLAGALTVFSVVRLSYVARRDEVEILHLVGAPLSTIRGPFVVEGVLQGLAGALLAFGLLHVVIGVAQARLSTLVMSALGTNVPVSVPWVGAVSLALGAAVVGGFAAWLAVRSAARSFVA
jgi:cell division transport system permease protein